MGLSVVRENLGVGVGRGFSWIGGAMRDGVCYVGGGFVSVCVDEVFWWLFGGVLCWVGVLGNLYPDGRV